MLTFYLNGRKMANPDGFESFFSSTILPKSSDMPSSAVKVEGMDFNNAKDRNITVAELLDSFARTGYQASHVSDAVQTINHMRAWEIQRHAATFPETSTSAANSVVNGEATPQHFDQIFFGYTSNLVSSGLRESIRWLVEHKHVSALVTTAGGIEEDIIKCLAPTYIGTFAADDSSLYNNHINRVGNLLVPNNNYVAFEDWLMPILQYMYEEQESRMHAYIKLTQTINEQHKAGLAATDGRKMTAEQQEAADHDQIHWTPSTVIARLGEAIDDSSSIIYWAYKNSIPIFCPGLTDGSFGDMLSAFQIRCRAQAPFASSSPTPSPIPRSPRGLVIDIADDIDRINGIARQANIYNKKLGAIILGSGIVKHHIMNACLNGGGADAAVYVNTADEFDGSDAGARPSEAVSWGKLKVGAKAVKVRGDATVIWPLIVAGTWARVEEKEKELER